MELSYKLKEIKPSATLEITAKANMLKQQGFDVVGFGAGEPDFDTPDNIKSAAIKAIQNGKTKYTPINGIIELRDALCKKFSNELGINYTSNEILVSAGGKHSLYNLFMSIINPGDEIIIPSPYWVSYPEMVKISGGKPIIVPSSSSENFKINREKLASAITNKTKGIIINSPSNPTGALYSKDELKSLIDVVKDKDILIISDDIYDKIIYDNKNFVNALMIYPELKDKTVIVNGASKTYSMTGWRIGYTAANKNIISGMSIIQGQSTSNPTSISQYAALESITGPQDFIKEMVSKFQERRDYIVAELNSIDGIVCNKPEGAFYVFPDISLLLKKKNFQNSVDFSKKLLDDQKVAVVPGDAFGNDNCIRLSYATSMDTIKKGVTRLKEFCR